MNEVARRILSILTQLQVYRKLISILLAIHLNINLLTFCYFFLVYIQLFKMLLKLRRPSIRSIKLYHENPEVFFKSQWQKDAKSRWYLIYRWTVCAFFIFVLTYSLFKDPTTILYFFIYLTNIGILLVTLFTLYGAIFVTLYQFDVIKIDSDSFNYKFFWILSSISIILAFTITIVYWSALYDWQSGRY